MDVEVVYHKMPLGDWRRVGQCALNMLKKIFLGARVATGNRCHVTGRHFEVDDERQRPPSNIFKLPALDLAWGQEQTRVFAFQGLHPGHFVSTHHDFALFREFWGVLIQLVDVGGLLVKPLICFLRQPVTDQMRLETPFFSSRDACRGEI